MEEKYEDKEGVILFPMELIGAFKWNKALGTRLKELRADQSLHPALGAVSRARLEKLLLERGVRYTQESIKKLEQGDLAKIDPDLLLTILAILGSSIESFFRVRIKCIVLE